MGDRGGQTDHDPGPAAGARVDGERSTVLAHLLLQPNESKMPLAGIDVEPLCGLESEPLSLGEPIDWAVEGHSDRFRYPAHHGPRNDGAKRREPCSHIANTLHQLGRRRRLQHVAIGAGPKKSLDVGLIVVRG